LNVQRPDISPRASGHIPEQIEMVQRLLEKDYAYEVNGSVYFDISKWPKYGVLSGRRVEDQRAGERLEVNDEKRHPADFALWKRAEPEHIMQWNSPWGRGYPGWHIECSAMSIKYLGETLDIHGGGMENQFPHHECEIAQSEAMTGKPFVRYWMHHNMVMVNGTKMSKSLNNFTSVQQALARYSGGQIRFFILQTHYRSPVDFSDESISASAQGLERLLSTRAQILQQIKNAEAGEVSSDIKELCAEYKTLFEKEMNDDFNTPAAIGQLFNFSREINSRLAGGLSRSSLELLRDTFTVLADDVLGILPEERREGLAADPFIDLLVTVRRQVRAQKNWVLSDFVRDKLADLGVHVKDEKEDSTWSYKN